jgi:hypothetical protein
VQQQRQDCVALDIALAGLAGARLAQYHRIDRLKVRRVGQQRQVNLIAVELTVRRGAEVIFDIARATDIGRIGRPPANSWKMAR